MGADRCAKSPASEVDVPRTRPVRSMCVSVSVYGERAALSVLLSHFRSAERYRIAGGAGTDGASFVGKVQ